MKQCRAALLRLRDRGAIGSMRNEDIAEAVADDKKLKTMMKFPKNVLAYPATASPEGVLGEGIFSAAIDEANFMEIIERSKRNVPHHNRDTFAAASRTPDAMNGAAGSSCGSNVSDGASPGSSSRSRVYSWSAASGLSPAVGRSCCRLSSTSK